LQTRWITWSASTRTWRSTSRRSCPRQRGLCWQGGRCGRTRAATRALVRGVGSRRLPGTASGGGREDPQPARRPAVGSSRVHGGGSGRNLVELLRGVLLRLRAVSFSLRPLRTLSVPRLPSQGRSPWRPESPLRSRHWYRAGASSTTARAGCDAEVAVYDRCCVAYVAAGDLRADRAAGRWQSDPGDAGGGVRGGRHQRAVCSLDVPPEELAAAIAGVRALGLSGFHIMAPHKAKVLPLLDEPRSVPTRSGRGGTGHVSASTTRSRWRSERSDPVPPPPTD
jgi:Shikimate dehydrogenase substrate binding domain